jgi:thiamine monophosphate synthase
VIPRLWVISPDDGRDLGPGITAFGRLGVRGLVLRESRAVARQVPLARDAGFTHIYAHLRAPDSLAAGADGIHLPEGAAVPDCAWGRSTHAAADARAALDAGAAYALLSPIWPPTSKPGDSRRPLGIPALLAAGSGPVLGLGGVDGPRLAALRAAGGYGAAVLGRWWEDPPAIAALLDAL